MSVLRAGFSPHFFVAKYQVQVPRARNLAQRADVPRNSRWLLKLASVSHAARGRALYNTSVHCTALAVWRGTAVTRLVRAVCALDYHTRRVLVSAKLRA